jgi:hypothetical protein
MPFKPFAGILVMILIVFTLLFGPSLLIGISGTNDLIARLLSALFALGAYLFLVSPISKKYKTFHLSILREKIIAALKRKELYFSILFILLLLLCYLLRANIVLDL